MSDFAIKFANDASIDHKADTLNEFSGMDAILELRDGSKVSGRILQAWGAVAELARERALPATVNLSSVVAFVLPDGGV